MQSVLPVVLVGVGYFLGGIARWAVTLGLGRLIGSAFPVGTFVVNISGCLFLGWLTTMLTERFTAADSVLRAENLRLLLAVGFTGAYTTFSTFEYETHKLLGAGDTIVAAAYVALSVFLGLLAVRCGVMLGEWR